MIKKYLEIHKKYIALTLVFICIFSTIMFLYRQELEAVLYASGICFLVAISVFICSYKNFAKKYCKLREFKNTEPFFDGNLPTYNNAIEQAYEEIIYSIKDELISQRNFIDQWKQDNSDYYTTWVHQIKTPIAAMKLMLQEQDTPTNLKLQSELFKIEEYVNMILVYSRLDEDASDFLIKEYKLDNIIRKVIRKYASQFIMKNISLNYQGTDKIVVTDEKWLGLLLEQIISNSIKYTNLGTVSIYVANNSIFISDTGIGIAKEDIPRIFDKGYTGYNGRIENKSTGLGLYLAKNIADKIGCEIKVTSALSKGSQFEIKFCNDLTKM